MKARLSFIALAWLAAFLILMSLFLALDRQVNGLPLALRVLIVSGAGGQHDPGRHTENQPLPATLRANA